MEGYWKCSRCAKLPDEDINEATSMCSEAANGDSAQRGFPEKIEKSSKYRSISAAS
jgi:hypothetical protein